VLTLPNAFVLAAVLGLLAIGWRRGCWQAAAWAALGIFGQAASLSLWQAGTGVGYQHLLSLGAAAQTRALPLVVTLGVGIIAIAGMAANRREASTWLRNRPLVLVAFALGLVLAAAPSASGSTWATEWLLAVSLQLIAVACVSLAVMSLPRPTAAALGDGLESLLSGANEQKGPDRFVWTAAALVTVVSAVLAVAAYERHPHVPDEVAYLIQAKYFAQGLLWMDAPPVPRAFEVFCLDIDGSRWFSVFPPGWPMILALGVLLGVPWLMNPILGGLCVIGTFLLVEELSDRRTARLAAALLAVSPWHVMLSMSLMSHVFSLALALGAGLGAARSWRTGSWKPALGAGLCLGVLGMSRPLEGVAVGLLIGIPLLLGWRQRFPGLAGFTVGTIITGGLGLAYNRVLTGSALVFPAERYFDRLYGVGRYGIGFGKEKGLGWAGLDPYPGHGLIDVVVNAVLNGFMVNIELFGWWTGSLFLVALGLFAARRRVDRIMAWSIVAVVGLHSVYWFSGGPDFGARYWYLIIVPCVVLAARGLDALALGTNDRPDQASASKRVLLGAALLCLSAAVTFVPWRATNKYFRYRGMRADLRVMVHDPQFRDGLILVRGEQHPDWASAASYNGSVLASGAPVFAWDRDSLTRSRLLSSFPDRPIWIVAGPSLTREGYRVIQGPITPADRPRLTAPLTR
jgi:hypothetical protein